MQYKSSLKRNSRLMHDHAVHVHATALKSVTRDNMLSYYRKIGCVANLPPPAPAVEAGDEAFAAAVTAAAAVAVHTFVAARKEGEEEEE